MFKQGIVVLGAVALVGCGGGDPLGEGDAQIAWESTQGAMGGSGASAPNGLSADAPCSDGGKIKWKYDLFGGVSAGVDNSVDIEYTLVFKGCKHDGVKMNGKMVYTISTMSGSEGSYVRWGYEGTLRYSGDINGSCDYSMYGQASNDANGASVSYEGSICGNDASATLNVTSSGVSNNLNGEVVDES